MSHTDIINQEKDSYSQIHVCTDKVSIFNTKTNFLSFSFQTYRKRERESVRMINQENMFTNKIYMCAKKGYKLFMNKHTFSHLLLYIYLINWMNQISMQILTQV